MKWSLNKHTHAYTCTTVAIAVYTCITIEIRAMGTHPPWSTGYPGLLGTLVCWAVFEK